MTLATRRRLRHGSAFGAVLLVALATWWAVESIGSKARADRERVLNQLIAASEAARVAGDPGAAYREIEAAVTQGRKLDPEGSPRLDALIDRRDQAARAEVEARLAGLNRLGVDQRLGEARTLAERVRRDPTLVALGDQVAAAVEATTTQQAEADCARAKAALEAGRASEAFGLAGRAHDHAGRLTTPQEQARLETEARAVLVEAVERFGLVLQPSDKSGGAVPLDHFAMVLWTEALAKRGYLLLPSGSPWSEVWAVHAPYQASASVVETREGLYLQSQNRATQIDGQFAVLVQGRSRWETRVYAQTRSPIPDLSAFVAGRLATADRRDAEIEQRLRDDARTAFRIQADKHFRSIPAPGPVAAPVQPPGPGGPASSASS